MNKLINLVVIGGLIVTLSGCGNKASETDVNTEKKGAEQVKTMVIEKQEVSRKIELSTTLQGYETMNIAPSLTGKIEHIYVEVGSHVKEGDMLVRMDQNQLNTTKLTYANLGIEYERTKALRETGTVSQQSYDQIKLQYDQTKESLDFLTVNTFVKARMNGVISAKNYEDGELYSGSPILTLTQIYVLKALINIPEKYFPVVKKGMTVNVLSDIYPDQVFPSTIEIIYPTIDASTHTFQAKLRIPNTSDLLRPGMYVRTNMEVGTEDVIVAPYQSVLKLIGSNERYIFLNNNGVAKRVSVELGQRFDDQIEIISPEISEGNEIIVLGQGRLVDGSKLSVVK